MTDDREAAERRRLDRLRALQVLDTPPEPLFDSLAALASQICGTPIALLSLIDADRQWFKANVGLGDLHETARGIAFCHHAIGADTLMEVGDATRDARFAANPLVTGEPGIRFYAGAPLVLSSGERLGTLCVIDRQPRQLDAEQLRMLSRLADAAVQALEMRQRLVERSMEMRGAHARAVVESEARMRAILDAQSELVAQSTPDGRLIYVNPAYAHQFGRRVDEVIGSNLFDYVHGPDRAIVRERIDQVLSSGRSFSSENRMHLPDGKECWMSWTNARQWDGAGKPLLHSTGRDVTARVLAERALRHSQAMLERTGRVAGVGGWEMDLGSGEVRWTDETRRLHEVPSDFQPTLETTLDFYEPASRAVLSAAVERGLRSGQPWDIELPLRTARGRRVWARAVGEVEFEDGRPVRLFGAFQDITERRRLHQQSEEREAFLRLLTDSLPMRIAYLDRERRYRFVNAQWCRDSGIEAEAALGRTRAELFPDLTDEPLRERAQAVLRGEPQRFELDEMVQGRLRHFEQRLTPDRPGDDGLVRGFFVAGIDITERSAAERRLREVAAILEHTTDFVIQANRVRRVRYMNPAAANAMLGRPWQPDESPFVSDLLPESTVSLFADQIQPVLARGAVWVGQSRARLADGQEIPVSHMVIAHRDERGEIERYSIVMRDISVLEAAQADKDRQTATVRSVANAIPSTVAVVDRGGRYLFVNRAFEALQGRPAEQMLGRSAREVLGEVEFERRWPWIQRALAGEPVHFELEDAGSEGRRYTALDYIPLKSPAGELDGFVVVGQDVTVQRTEAARLQWLSQTDPLTRLLNRAGFEQRLRNLLDERLGEPLALLYVDLDRFKPVNDTHGHAAGDELLKLVAQRLVRLVRPSDTVARLGGDEFAIALAGMRDPFQAQRVAQSIVDAMRQPFGLSGGFEVTIGASVGGVLGEATQGTWAALLRRADEMLYEAKGAGRDRAFIAS